jgi:hypothetical protein
MSSDGAGSSSSKKVSLRSRQLTDKQVKSVLIVYPDEAVTELDVSENAIQSVSFLQLFTQLVSCNVSHNLISTLHAACCLQAVCC